MTREYLFDRTGKIDYKKTVNSYSWLMESGHNIILSPDSDGFLCGLFLTNFLDSNICGFYDGKLLLLKKGIKTNGCIFVDVDINRNSVMSIGHHMVQYNKLLSAPNFQYDNCIQPNLIRNFDGRSDFQRKYPFGTIHLLLAIYHEGGVINKLSENAVWPLLFTDGVWNNLFGYTENCLDWIYFLDIDDKNNILHNVFCDNNHSVYDVMRGINSFLRIRDSQNAKGFYSDGEYTEGGRNKRTGDKLRISNNRGEPINIQKQSQSLYKIHDLEKSRVISFIKHMATQIEWNFLPDKWTWENFSLYVFSKDDFSGK